jgi:serine/threonine protein kinase
MILGQSYTKAADIWSAGVLLYAMVAGELPFDDPNGIHEILVKIASAEPSYPDVMSSALIDLLRRILTKSPETRLDIERIKEHPWFSHSEYLMIFQIPFSEEDWLVRGVDRTIVDEMEQMGIDVRNLAEAILCGEYTTETAIYSMIRRKRITQKVHEVMETLINGPSSGLMVTSSLLPICRRGPDRGRSAIAEIVARRGKEVPTRRAVIGNAANPLAVPPTPTIVRPKPVGQIVRRPRSGTLQ